jgi:hypothetical protein
MEFEFEFEFDKACILVVSWCGLTLYAVCCGGVFHNCQLISSLFYWFDIVCPSDPNLPLPALVPPHL